jgi:YebC/PmpR family DNA-binding regulatory protein
MAGHNKWSKIKHRKQAADSRKGKEHNRLAKEIAVAAKLGGSDPSSNFRLRSALARARAASLSNAVIARAMERHLGEANELTEIVYEGYGPQGVALLIEVATSNRNRTVAQIREILKKTAGSLGESGCVSWGFERVGLISIVASGLSEENLLELATQIEARDFWTEEERAVLVLPPDQLSWGADWLAQQGYDFTCEVTYLPTMPAVEIQGDGQDLEATLNALEELEDVRAVHHPYIA